jgi:hypothetical protein
MTTKKITRELPVKLTPKQLDEKRDELADAVLLRTKLEQDLRDVSAGERKKIKDAKAAAKRIATEIQSEAATMEVACTEELHYATNRYIVTRLDTKEVVEERKLTDDERQEPMTVAGTDGKKRKLTAVPNPEEPPASPAPH